MKNLRLTDNLFNLTWNVVYTKPGQEKKVADYLVKKNIEYYLPLKKAHAPWWYYKKTIDIPVFSSLIFINSADQKVFRKLKNIDGVINFLYWKNKPAEITDGEIKKIKYFLANEENVSAEKISVGGNYIKNQVNLTLTMPDNSDTSNRYIKVDLNSLGYRLIAEDNDPKSNVIDLKERITNSKLKRVYSHAS